MKKKCICKVSAIVVFMLLLIMSISWINHLCLNKTIFCVKDEFYEHSDEYDILFFGTSHVYNQILPQELWQEYGISSFNWGYSNCTVAMDYYVLKNALRYSKPKLVVIDMAGIVEYEQYGNGKYKADQMGSARDLFSVIPFSLDKITAVNDIFDDYPERMDIIFPLIYYHGKWDSLSKRDFEYENMKQKGALYISSVGYGIRYEKIEPVMMEIDTACSRYIQPIIDLCNEKDVELLFIYAPSVTSEDGTNSAYALEEILKQKGANYINLITADFINNNIDFAADGGHLNYSGSKKLTSYLGQYMITNYDIKDHRNEEKYHKWNNDYLDYVQYKIDELHQHDDIFTEIMLTYGDDFDMQLYIDSNCDIYENNAYLWPFIHNGNMDADPIKVDDLYVLDQKCDLMISVRNTLTNEEVLKNGYVVQNGEIIQIINEK